ncbi:MAG: AAA family ATPase [Woeseiaceae bacterium]
MISDSVFIKNVKGVVELEVTFDFSDRAIIVITGKNGVGKTTLVKSFKLISDLQVFKNSLGLKSIRSDSNITVRLHGHKPFLFSYNSKLDALDTKQVLPKQEAVSAELPIPDGARFQQYAFVAGFDAEMRANIASDMYQVAEELIGFLSQVYLTDKFSNLKFTKIKNNNFYFVLLKDDYYIREDHLSSGEFFLIQLFRLITSGSELIIIDELDVSLDAAAQVHLFEAIKPYLEKYNSRLIVVSHSLAFMSTVDDGGLYLLEDNSHEIILEQRSFGFVKSALYGFEGYDRYILTEDVVMEGFIEYIIGYFSMSSYYQHMTIGVGGWNQLKLIIEKNDCEKIFTDSSNVIGVVDGDAYPKISQEYSGGTRILCSPVDDIEKFIFLNRESLLPEIDLPAYSESKNVKRASKTYWKYLTVDKQVTKNHLYQLVIDSQNENTKNLVSEIIIFLGKD